MEIYSSKMKMKEREEQNFQVYKTFGKEPLDHSTNTRGESTSSSGSQVRKVLHRLCGLQDCFEQLFLHSGDFFLPLFWTARMDLITVALLWTTKYSSSTRTLLERDCVFKIQPKPFYLTLERIIEILIEKMIHSQWWIFLLRTLKAIFICLHKFPKCL